MKLCYRLICTLAVPFIPAFSLLANDTSGGLGPYVNVAEGNPMTKRNRAIKLLADQSVNSLIAGNSRSVSGQTKFSATAGVATQAPAPARQVSALVATTDEMVPLVAEVFDSQPQALRATHVTLPNPTSEQAARINDLMTETKAPVLVVMGHITPELESYLNGTATPPAGPMAKAVAKARKHSDPAKQVATLVDEVVLFSITDLIHSSSTLGGKIRAGSIYVTGARYDASTGEVHLIVTPVIQPQHRFAIEDIDYSIVSPSS